MTLSLRGITKRFGDLVANDHIDLEIEPGRIHALLGENGAGKSTLMNVLYGLLTPDEGEILVDGTPVTFANPGQAIDAGIGMVHQHFMLVPVFTVAENVSLGSEPTSRGGFLDRAAAARQVREISERHGLRVDPDAVVEDLPVGVQQRVEIIKALSRDAKYLILDEPTAVLTPQETDELMDVMRGLRDHGTAIVFITHKLREVRAVADTITIIRRGKVVGTAEPTASEAELASAMVGRDVRLHVDKAAAQAGDPLLEVRGLTVLDPRDVPVVKDVSFDVRRGEVLAVAGVQGNGQSELISALLGLEERAIGSVRLEGQELLGRSTDAILDGGVGYVPEDRRHDGIISSFSVTENLVLDLFDNAPFSRRGILDLKAMADNAATQVDAFDIRTPSADAGLGTLSGGNQQKVVLARELSRPLKLLVVAQPTRGLDVGSIEFVHKRIVEERDKGTAVLVVSTELDEVYSLADRIAVMYDGRIVDVVSPETSREDLGLLMAGAQKSKAV